MVDEDVEEEQVNDSFLKKLQNMDVDALNPKAQTIMTEKEADCRGDVPSNVNVKNTPVPFPGLC